MNRFRWQQTVGLVVITGHLFIMLSVLYYFANGGLRFEEMTTSLALMSPMFAVYTTAIIKHFVKYQYMTTAHGKNVNTPYMLVSLILPTLYLVLVFLMVRFRANRQVFDTFDQFTSTLGVLEVAFGVYAAQTLGSLFEIEHQDGALPRIARRQQAAGNQETR